MTQDFNNLITALSGCAASLSLQAVPGQKQNTVAAILRSAEPEP
jgi:hypothetical protein